ncbi:MAG: hypothetical protein ACKV2V_18335 [Blastocatellia bacterium]
MAEHDENECAWCASHLVTDSATVGRDMKVYCSPACAEAGTELSDLELSRWYQPQIPMEQLLSGIFSSRR